MGKAEASVEELVGRIERGELRLPEMQRQYVWQGTRVRDLLDSLYRGYPSGAILLWETDEKIPERTFAVNQDTNPYGSTQLLLDGAYFGGSGTPISAEVEHRFRPKWNTDSGKWNTDFGMWNIHSGRSGTPVPES